MRAASGTGDPNDVIPSLVSMYQSGVRRNLSAELHRVSMPALPVAAGGAARSQGVETPQRRELEGTFREALQEQRMALRLRRVGQEGMDPAGDCQPRCRFTV